MSARPAVPEQTNLYIAFGVEKRGSLRLVGSRARAVCVFGFVSEDGIDEFAAKVRIGEIATPTGVRPTIIHFVPVRGANGVDGLYQHLANDLDGFIATLV